MNDNLIETIGLKKYFSTSKGLLHAVDDVSITIPRGQTLGVVGESGCGKSTLGRTILRLTQATEGKVLFDGQDVLKLRGNEMKKCRQQMQIIMQDPYSSLNPRMTVKDLIADPLRVNKIYNSEADIAKETARLMDIVGLAARLTYAYPHELDGGRRQRIGVARAIALKPKFIVCDEPVSALDVSIQAQTLNLLMDLQKEMNLTYMFITHDLSVVKHISHKIVVMYLGRTIEVATSDELFLNPCHPYTKALLSAIPVADIDYYKTNKIEAIKGEVTSPINPVPGCRFAPRCPKATERCTQTDLPLRDIGNGHLVSCVLFE